jgi:predicted double-glycine peptidase
VTPRRATVLLLAVVAGCSKASHDDAPSVARAPGGLPPNALPVPLVSQANEYSCGAAALEAVLYYWQVFDGHETALYGPLDTTPEKGTEPWSIVNVARSFGLDAVYRRDASLLDVRQGWDKGDTVILDLQAWQEDDKPKKPWKDDWDDGHYVVLVAMDDSRLYAMDPSAHVGLTELPIVEFLDRWHDCEEHDGGKIYIQHMAIFVHGTIHVDAGTLVRMQ